MTGPSQRSHFWSWPVRGAIVLAVLAGIVAMHGLCDPAAENIRIASSESVALCAPMAAAHHASSIPMEMGSQFSPGMSCAGHQCLAIVRAATNVTQPAQATDADQNRSVPLAALFTDLRSTSAVPATSVSLTRLGICRV
jgi:hypothetical protein